MRWWVPRSPAPPFLEVGALLYRTDSSCRPIILQSSGTLSPTAPTYWWASCSSFGTPTVRLDTLPMPPSYPLRTISTARLLCFLFTSFLSALCFCEQRNRILPPPGYRDIQTVDRQTFSPLQSTCLLANISLYVLCLSVSLSLWLSPSWSCALSLSLFSSLLSSVVVCLVLQGSDGIRLGLC